MKRYDFLSLIPGVKDLRNASEIKEVFSGKLSDDEMTKIKDLQTTGTIKLTATIAATVMIPVLVATIVKRIFQEIEETTSAEKENPLSKPEIVEALNQQLTKLVIELVGQELKSERKNEHYLDENGNQTTLNPMAKTLNLNIGTIPFGLNLKMTENDEESSVQAEFKKDQITISFSSSGRVINDNIPVTPAISIDEKYFQNHNIDTLSIRIPVNYKLGEVSIQSFIQINGKLEKLARD